MSSRNKQRQVLNFDGATVQIIKSLEVQSGDLLFISSPQLLPMPQRERFAQVLKKALNPGIEVIFITGGVKIEGVVRYVEPDEEPAEDPVSTSIISQLPNIADTNSDLTDESLDPTRLVNIFRDVSAADAPTHAMGPTDFRLNKKGGDTNA